MRRLKDIQVVSFDLDGTLVNRSYIDFFWNELVPLKYAEVHNVDIKTAKRLVLRAYDNIGSSDIRWYQVNFWAKEFELDNINELVDEAVRRAYIYPEVYELLNTLSRRYILVISTNADMVFVMKLLKVKRLLRYFKRIFSCVTHMKLIRKEDKFYRWICSELNMKPYEVLHVGDDPIYDYQVPRGVGINAYLIDRDSRFIYVEHRLQRLDELQHILA